MGEARHDTHRVEFDATLDEIVDVNMLLAEHTKTYRQQRRGMQWVVGLCAGGAFVVSVTRQSYSPTFAALALAAVAGAVVGAAAAFLYGRYHDWYIRRHYRRMVAEMYRGAERVHFEVELRDDVLWVRSMQAELALPWSRLTRVNDAQGSIELWFDPGLAVVRDRAFRTKEERDGFLGAIRRRLPGEGI